MVKAAPNSFLRCSTLAPRSHPQVIFQPQPLGLFLLEKGHARRKTQTPEEEQEQRHQKVIKHLWLCCVCAVVYFGSKWIALPTTGMWFFLEMSTWSFIVCIAAYHLGSRWVAVAVLLLEAAAITVNLASALDSAGSGWVWRNYDQAIMAIAMAEALVLLAGALWDGVRRMVRECGGRGDYRLPAMVRHWLARKEGQA